MGLKTCQITCWQKNCDPMHCCQDAGYLFTAVSQSDVTMSRSSHLINLGLVLASHARWVARTIGLRSPAVLQSSFLGNGDATSACVPPNATSTPPAAILRSRCADRPVSISCGNTKRVFLVPATLGAPRARAEAVGCKQLVTCSNQVEGNARGMWPECG